MLFDPAHTALLIIDMQRDFLEKGGYADLAGMDITALRKPIQAIAKLLHAVRRQGMLVIHTREGHPDDLSDCTPAKLARSHATGAVIGMPGPLGRLLIRGEYGHDIIDELIPMKNETVLDKPGYGAFYQTDLHAMLQSREIRYLLFTGVTTEVCVHSSLREAVDRGYQCVLVQDACGSAHPALHAAAVEMVRVEGGIFGQVAECEEILASFGIYKDLPAHQSAISKARKRLLELMGPHEHGKVGK